MTALAVVQARMGSTRLPGKVLADVGGMPMLEFMLRRVLRAPVDDLVVATSHLERDDPIAETAAALRVAVVRGSEADVLERFVLALDDHPADDIVRLTGDCPLTDPEVIGEALRVHRTTRADYTSNTIVRTFPDGLDVEVVRADALRVAADEATAPDEREHVTPFLYRRPERFALAAFRCSEFLGDERWTVDTAEDLAWVRDVAARLGGTGFSWRDVLRVGPRREGRSADGPLLLPHETSTPARRVWRMVDGAAELGGVTLVIEAGRGRAFVDVPVGYEDDAIRLLEDRLKADAQVVELVSRPRDPS